MAKKETLWLLLGAGAIVGGSLFGTRKKARASPAPSENEPPAPVIVPEVVVPDDDLDAEDPFVVHRADPPPISDSESPEPEIDFSAVLVRNIDASGRSQLGMLYQVRDGDSPIEVCLEALFGSRSATSEEQVQAARELLIRIDCGPWNQALYAVQFDEIAEDGGYFAYRGVSFDPIYQDNAARIAAGLRPTSAPGNSYALIWIPMINEYRFDMDMTVTTEGMSYPDTEHSIGGSMIDPPDEILDLEFDQVSSDHVGCNLPEGDYRRLIVSH